MQELPIVCTLTPDEIEAQIGLRPTPATWPVGIAGDLRGVIDRQQP